MATLQIINNIWRYEDQNRNAQTIADAAGRLYDQFVLFTEALDKVGDHIKKAGDSYDLARKRLVDGKGNLVGRIQKLQDLGVKPKKSIARELLDQAEIEDGRPPPVEKSDPLSDSDSDSGAGE
jgi:DNA recombination protein RmuC